MEKGMQAQADTEAAIATPASEEDQSKHIADERFG